MKVLQIPRRFVTSDWGGTETVVLETGKRLSDMGVESRIFCPNALAHSNSEVVDGLRVTRFPYFYPYWGLDAATRLKLDKKGGNLFSFSLMQGLRTEPSLDLIHLHTGKRLGGIARFIARRRRIPYVVSLHGGVYDVPAAEARSWAEPTEGLIEWGKVLGCMVGSRRVLRDADAIICVGWGEYQRCREAFPDSRVEYLPNGVDSRRFSDGNGERFRRSYGLDPAAPLVLSVGRIDPQKNQIALVQQFPELKRRHPNIQLAIVGPVTDRSYRRDLDRRISETGAASDIRVIEGLSPSGRELVDAYHAADVFVLPSRHEPFGIVILEAWAAGTPVVTNEVGGVRQLVTHGENAFVVSPSDPDGLARGVLAVLEEPELAASIAAAGERQARDTYDWAQITLRLKSIYDGVVREYCGRAA